MMIILKTGADNTHFQADNAVTCFVKMKVFVVSFSKHDHIILQASSKLYLKSL